VAEYTIRLSGCDDTTEFGVELNDNDAALLKRIARMSRDLSDSNCQPRMTVGDDEYMEMTRSA
jgi:hypothetical protein